MGQETSRHKRRHTVTVNPSTPYIKTQAQIHGIVNNGNGNVQHNPFANKNKNNCKKPSTISIPTHNAQAYSADFAVPNKMVRSVSTPTFSDHQKITKATRDLNATTPNQHLITVIQPQSNKQTSNITKKKKSSFVLVIYFRCLYCY